MRDAVHPPVETRFKKRQTGASTRALQELAECGGMGLHLSCFEEVVQHFRAKAAKNVVCASPVSVGNRRGYCWKLVVLDEADFLDVAAWEVIRTLVLPAMHPEGRIIELRTHPSEV